MSESVNKIYSGEAKFNSSIVSKVRTNREYLLSSYVADELNTYRTWEAFPIINDAYKAKYDVNDSKYKELEPEKGPGTPGVRSIFNKAGAVALGHTENSGEPYDVTKDSHSWRISNNVPLMDSPSNRKQIKEHSKCTIKDLVEASEQGLLGRETYSYSDFMYCKYLGKVPNNYLITLRRFPVPVNDYISNIGVEPNRGDNKSTQADIYPSIGCMVTWMGTPGNEMSNILKYSYKMPFKFQNAGFYSQDGSGDDSSNPLNSIAAAFDPTYRKHYMRGEVGNAFNSYVGKFFGAGSNPYNLAQITGFTDQNKVYGPVDTIKGTYMRDESGLEFDQKISLQFDYELRSYNGINPRQAMLDLLSNILNVTYSTGTFWGGGYRGVGVSQNNIFSNMKIFKADGGFSSFVDAFAQDYSTISGKVSNALSGGNIIQTLKSALNAIGGMILGGLLNKMGRPAKIMATTLLSPAAVGFWHVTIGNPHHPIMSLGNMILTNTTVEHYGPLGLDDFPTGLRVTCELERGKPRDIRDIEKIYMHGNDRIFSSMGNQIKKMYECSKEYKSKNNHKSVVKSTVNGELKDSTNEKSTVIKTKGQIETITNQTPYTTDENKLKDMKDIYKKYFGISEEDYIINTAMEQENGSQPKKKTKAS